MNTEEYISSGILELYLYGVLSEVKNVEITEIIRQHPEIENEVKEIEKALIELSSAVAPKNPQYLFDTIKEKLSEKKSEVPILKIRKPWIQYAGWAASLLFLIGLFLFSDKNRELKETLKDVKYKNAQLEKQITQARNNSEKAEELLGILRDKNILKVPLQGQKIKPDSYATVYWNEKENIAYIDGKGLPQPPKGMVYQVWSLKMQPLMPTSIGLLDAFDADQNKIFRMENSNKSEGFGITLEPVGGSETPTLERLYALGVVKS